MACAPGGTTEAPPAPVERGGARLAPVRIARIAGADAKAAARDPAMSSARILRVRVGIHTGLTVIGDAADAPTSSATASTLAARIQSAAAPDTVVISGPSLRPIRGIFVIAELGAQRLAELG